MKQTSAKAYNIAGELVGRVTYGKTNLLDRGKSILVTDEPPRFLFGYKAVISSKGKTKGKYPYLSVNEISTFNEGDVISVNDKGEIIFLYEINSPHNAIMATEKCNHRCIMCPQPPVVQEKDRTDFNINLIPLFDKSTKEIGITGGEPTLIGDKLFTLILRIKKTLPKAGISLLSNGVRFADKSYALKLAQCQHRDLQIDIPLFSDIPDEHNRIVGAKTFYKTVQGLYNLALFKQKIGIRIVIHWKSPVRVTPEAQCR